MAKTIQFKLVVIFIFIINLEEEHFQNFLFYLNKEVIINAILQMRVLYFHLLITYLLIYQQKIHCINFLLKLNNHLIIAQVINNFNNHNNEVGL